MADDDATMLQRQSASNLLWGMSHRKAFAHAVPQVRLARPLEAALPPPPALGQLLSPDRLIAARPALGGRRGAPQRPTKRRPRPIKRRGKGGWRSTAGRQ